MQLLHWCKRRLEGARKHGLVVGAALCLCFSLPCATGQLMAPCAESNGPHVQRANAAWRRHSDPHQLPEGHLESLRCCLRLRLAVYVPARGADYAGCAVSSSSYMGKTWLDNVHGCACCLSRTSSVTACYLAAKGCSSPHALSDCCERQDDEARLPKVQLLAAVNIDRQDSVTGMAPADLRQHLQRQLRALR